MTGLNLLVLVFVFFGWVPLLISGIVRWRRGAGGTWTVAGAAVWGATAVCVAYALADSLTRYARYAPQPFDASTYTGEVATLAFPADYTGSGSLLLSAKGVRWIITVSETNRVQVPAGEYVQALLSVTVPFDGMDGWTHVSFRCEFSRPFSVAQAETVALPGGSPFLASLQINARKGYKDSVNLVMEDSAGNKVSADSLLATTTFEALTLGGECFWRDSFKHDDSRGGYPSLGQMPEHAPSSFTIRPILPPLPFAVETVETQWGVDW